MLSIAALREILGIKNKVYLTTEEMADKLNLTFYPVSTNASKEVLKFAEKLKESLTRLKVNVVPYSAAVEYLPYTKRFKRFFKYSASNFVWVLQKIFRKPETDFYIPFSSIVKLSSGKRIKKNICVVCVGEQNTDDLPMQFIKNFKTNSIITIVDFPKNINKNSDFTTHFDESMKLFAYHMANIILAVDISKWMVYNFNASHPIYDLNDNKLDEHILESLIPKIIAPISPNTFKEFKLSSSAFNINDPHYLYSIDELRKGGQLFSSTNLYPNTKKIDELPFRHNFHRLIGKLHLDNRSGMSFGFLAFQLPTTLSPVVDLGSFRQIYPNAFSDSDIYINKSKKIFILFDIYSEKLVLKVPEVWVMTLRSGSNKTHFNVNLDLLKMGLINGEMWLEFPKDLKIDRDYKPSFDTKVILAHAVGNSIIASLLRYKDANHNFAKLIQEKGMALAHWHGYFNQNYIPKGITLYGRDNPHVSCSSPQSAIFALGGKLKAFEDRVTLNETSDYRGDIHVEPHHGINISFPSLVELASYILSNPESTKLGNKYL